MIYKVNSLFWDQNEKMCLRQINVYDLDRQIAVLNCTKHDGKWTCTFVPMGYKFSTEEMVNLSSCVSKSIVLMKVLELDTVTLDEVQENIDNV